MEESACSCSSLGSDSSDACNVNNNADIAIANEVVPNSGNSTGASDLDVSSIEKTLLTRAAESNMASEFRSGAGVDVSPKKDGGVMKVVKKAGRDGTSPLFGDVVYLKYSRWLVEGDIEVDSNFNEQEPYSFTVGKADVILAWEFGIPTMTEGEVALFLCRPDYAYGAEGLSPIIPPDAVLLFKIELLHWHGKDISDAGDGSIYKSLLEEGETYGIPNEGANCTVHIVGRCDCKIFEEREVAFTLGEGSESGVIPGVEQALLRFSRKEKGRLKIKSYLAYGSEGCSENGIPPNADLEYDVHLLECTRAKDFWDMTGDEKLQQSLLDKQKGVSYYKAGKLPLAMRFFEKVIEYLQFEELTEDCGDAETRKNLLVSCHANLALCQLRGNNPLQAHEACSKALLLEPSNEKCLFRRASANMQMKDFRCAFEDWSSVIKLNPTNRIASRQLALASRKLLDAQEEERRIYKGMFDSSA